MFIIERRTAGVLAALGITAAVIVLADVWDPVDEVELPHAATSTPALAASVGPGAGAVAPGANGARTGSPRFARADVSSAADESR